MGEEMKLTKEEISLCKQVVEKYKKEIGKGDWVYYHGFRYLVEDAWILEDMCPLPEAKLVGHANIVEQSECIPLWTISDCLEFLREKCQDHVLLIHDKEDEVEWFLWMDEYEKTQQMGKGKTPLEACLKAVLAVLEEGK